MSQNGKLMPNLDHQSTKVHNLTVLQRIDAFVEEILITAGHVTSYDFDIELNQWSRKDVEGSLFVVKRSTQPRFQFIILNRRKTDNLVENILGDFEYEVQVPYLLYRNAAQEVNGIWFYSSQDCEAVANLFSRILNAFSRVPPQPKVSSTKSGEFEELESLSTSDAIERSREPPTSSAACAPDVPDDSFVNFFSAATQIGNGPNAAFAGQPHQLNLLSNISGQTCQSSADNLLSKLSFNAPSVVAAPTLQPAPLPSAPLMPLLDTHESSIGGHHSTSLIKPSSFAPAPTSSALMMPPISSSIPTAPPLHPPVTMQQPYGTPLLQPFPPPTPPPSLTPAPTSNYEAVITREKVQDALLRLVQNNQFIDMVYREMQNAHYQ